ncbi:MAG TPA: tetratricopeptide repeat protein [Methylovirgula sp.]|nr:tetratricopeptide repeat protein [Methylovirgula sp.]
MRTSSRNRLFAVVGIAAFASAVGVVAPSSLAFDGSAQTAATTDKTTPLQIFKNPQAALRAGLEDFKSGNSRSGLEALKYAAAGGESLARWKLAKMYADGDGVPHDDIKAYEYFSQIVQDYDEDNPDPRELPVVSSAFVALGAYSLNGIANTKVTPDPLRALAMFQYAATNFGDPNAQYDLARMYLDGNGVGKDPAQAARWLHLAAEKNHAEAQALLGQLLFTGRDGVPRQRGLGLMYLTLARDTAVQNKKDPWIVDLYNSAAAAATDNDKEIAQLYITDYKKKHD